MNAPFKQDTRLGRLTTVLGKDVLNLLRFSGADHMNDLFTYRIEALSTEPNLDFDALIGTHASVEIESQNDGTRVFDGIVTEAQWAGVGENGNKYELTLRPWLWLASRRRNQRIFHNQSVVQIIEKLFAPYSGLGKPALKVNLSASYPDLEYTVQYRESDMAFATRLMERFGISYHFTHALGSHTLVLTDTVESHPMVAGGAREYKPVDGARQANAEHFWEWFAGRRLTTGAMRLTDYNFKTPMAAMEVDRIGDAAYEQGQIESYDYPGDYLDQGRGKDVVGLRTQAERGQDMRHRATGDCTSLGAGMRVTLTGDQVPGVKDTKYLCLSATHSYVSDAYGSGDAQSDGYAYSGSYVFMPDTAPLAPERKTDIPVVQGPQTAVVVGEGEIDCDEYGRILVHFHWDLEKAYSMRCRVSQNWASKGWGGMVIPRIGMEVVVEFLEGDPDKPLVTGCVYNGKNDVPYALPEHKTRSTFKTDTHKGKGFNELRFEDEDGEEEIFVHAQKDRNEKTLHNLTTRTDNNQVLSIGHVFVQEVEYAKQTFVGGNYSLRIGATESDGPLSSGLRFNDQGVGVYGYRLGEKGTRLKPKGNYSLRTEGNQFFVAQNNITISSDKSVKIESDDDMAIDVSDSLEISTSASFSESVGGKKYVRASEAIQFVCGKSSLSMKSTGEIILRGKRIAVHGQDNVELRGGRLRAIFSGLVSFLGKRIDLN